MYACAAISDERLATFILPMHSCGGFNPLPFVALRCPSLPIRSLSIEFSHFTFSVSDFGPQSVSVMSPFYSLQQHKRRRINSTTACYLTHLSINTEASCSMAPRKPGSKAGSKSTVTSQLKRVAMATPKPAR